MARSSYVPRHAFARPPARRLAPLTRSLAALAVGGLLVGTASPGFAMATGPTAAIAAPAQALVAAGVLDGEDPAVEDDGSEPDDEDSGTADDEGAGVEDADEDAEESPADAPAEEAPAPEPEPSLPAEPAPTETSPAEPEPSLPATPKVELGLSLDTVAPGQTITVAGQVTGFEDGTEVRIVLSNGQSKLVTVSEGRVSAKFIIAADTTLQPGDEVSVSNTLTDDQTSFRIAQRTLTASPAKVHVGDTVTITGAGFPLADVNLEIGSDTVTIRAGKLDDRGGFTRQVVAERLGKVQVSAGTLEASFDVEASLQAGVAKLWPGEQTSIESAGHEPGAEVAFTVEGPAGSTERTETADAKGKVSFLLSAATLGSGTSTVTSPTTSEHARVQVLSPALSGGTMEAGKPFTITGVDFKPGSQVNLYLGDTLAAEDVLIGEDGQLEATVTAPARKGNYAISTSASTATAVLVVTPSTKPTPEPTPEPTKTPEPEPTKKPSEPDPGPTGTADPVVPVPAAPATNPAIPATPKPTKTPDVTGDSNLDEGDSGNGTVTTFTETTDPTQQTPTPVPEPTDAEDEETAEPSISPTATPTFSPTGSPTGLPTSVPTTEPAPEPQAGIPGWLLGIGGFAAAGLAAIGWLISGEFRAKNARGARHAEQAGPAGPAE